MSRISSSSAAGSKGLGTIACTTIEAIGKLAGRGGEHEDDSQLAGRFSGVHTVLLKPLRIDELAAVVADCCDGAGAVPAA
jgi:hypothetical protein